MKKIAFVTLFPDWIRSSLGHSILARAEASGLVDFSIVNPRNFCYDPHKKVDDVPYGGHPGMLMKAEPVALAIEAVFSRQSAVSSWQDEGKPVVPSSPGEEGVGDGGDLVRSSERDGFEPGEAIGEVATSPLDGKQSKNSPLTPKPPLPDKLGEGELGSNPITSTDESESSGDSFEMDSSPTRAGVHNDGHPEGALHVESEERTGKVDLNDSLEAKMSDDGRLARFSGPHNSQLTTHNSKTAIILTEPSGIPFTQAHAEDLATYDQIIFVCGHYEGIDHRIEETFATHVFSIGDYVLTNGELPALVMADAVTRLIPGVLGNENSLDEESFQNNLLGAPNYTRPEVWRGVPIPEVLKSGNHKAIEKWRHEQAIERTKNRRPDLVKEPTNGELS